MSTKQIKLLASFVICFSVNLYATENQNDANNTVTKKCSIISQEETFPMGDTTGKYVLTNQIVKRECNITTQIKGKCIKWKISKENFGITPDSYDTYKSNSNTDSMGQLLSTVNAYGQLSHLWSGWKGYCVSGIQTDFSWMTDPMFWASMAVSYALDSANYASSANAAKAGNTAANAGSTAANTATSTASQVSVTVGNSVNSASSSLADSFNYSSFGENLINATNGAVYMSQAFGKCMLAYTMNMVESVKNYTDNDTIGCDPVDEFCGEGEDNKAESQSDVMTMDTTKLNDMLTAHPKYKEYIYIIHEENGVTTFRFKRPDEISGIGYAQNNEAMQKAMDKLKKVEFAINTTMSTVELASCIGTNGSVGEDANYNNGSTRFFSVQNDLSMGVNYLPVDPATKAALKIALQLAYSFKPIDSCHNEKDAMKEGSRHEKTEEALPYGLCHFVNEDCVDKGINSCMLNGYHYCCYDQVLTRVLVEQMKAQLGRDWTHCTGISLRDLKFVSFRQCTDADKKKGFDGAHQVGNYDPMQSYQFKAKCIDYTDLINYLKATVSPDININDFNGVIDDLSRQADTADQ